MAARASSAVHRTARRARLVFTTWTSWGGSRRGGQQRAWRRMLTFFDVAAGPPPAVQAAQVAPTGCSATKPRVVGGRTWAGQQRRWRIDSDGFFVRPGPPHAVQTRRRPEWVHDIGQAGRRKASAEASSELAVDAGGFCDGGQCSSTVPGRPGRRVLFSGRSQGGEEGVGPGGSGWRRMVDGFFDGGQGLPPPPGSAGGAGDGCSATWPGWGGRASGPGSSELAIDAAAFAWRQGLSRRRSAQAVAEVTSHPARSCVVGGRRGKL